MSYNPYGNPFSQPPPTNQYTTSGPSYPGAYAPTTSGPVAGPSYSTSSYPSYDSGYGAPPGVGGESYDANLAQQQSIYTPEASKKYKPLLPPGVAGGGAGAGGAAGSKARTTVLRKGGGEVWEDASLMEWDPSHFRLFIGDLDPALSDDLFIGAFSGVRYPSFVKAKIIRDKYTNKGKGYGFVSYSDPEDFLKAWKEMNGKYVGTRPVKISKATAGVAAVNIGNKKAAALDAKRKVKSGTVPYEKSKAAEAEGQQGRGAGSGNYGPERSRKSYIRR